MTEQLVSEKIEFKPCKLKPISGVICTLSLFSVKMLQFLENNLSEIIGLLFLVMNSNAKQVLQKKHTNKITRLNIYADN